MIFIYSKDSLADADVFFIVGILVVCVIWITVSMYKEAFKTEKKETKTGSYMDIEQLQKKYEEIMDINVRLLEEIRHLRFENSYLSTQTHCSDSDLMNNSEFQQNLKDLIILSHPDKHGGHERAKRITQWLLQLRQKN